jgi:hypothetical protein
VAAWRPITTHPILRKEKNMSQHDQVQKQGTAEDEVDKWYVHRYPITQETPVLKDDKTVLRVTYTDGLLQADFDLEDGSDPMALHKNCLDRESFYGEGDKYKTRIIPFRAGDPQQPNGPQVEALVGIISLIKGSVGVRDIFLAIREDWNEELDLSSDFDFTAYEIQLPFFDHKIATHCSEIDLNANSNLDLKNNPLNFKVKVKASDPNPPCNARVFQGGDAVDQVGGIYLPMGDTRALLMLFYHHVALPIETPGSTSLALTHIPGDPLCTTLHAGLGYPVGG